jgi:transcriptional regulator with XRE-family HTH domain
VVTRIGRKKAPLRRIYLREWREYRDLTQQQLADRLETTDVSVSRIENLRRDPTLRFLTAAAEALSCSVADLLTRQPPPKGEPLPPSLEDQLRALLKKTG